MSKEIAMTEWAVANDTDSLDEREHQIVSFVVEGLNDSEIALRLSLTEQAVQDHIQDIFTKLDVWNRLELVFCALYRRQVNRFAYY